MQVQESLLNHLNTVNRFNIIKNHVDINGKTFKLGDMVRLTKKSVYGQYGFVCELNELKVYVLVYEYNNGCWGNSGRTCIKPQNLEILNVETN